MTAMTPSTPNFGAVNDIFKNEFINSATQLEKGHPKKELGYDKTVSVVLHDQGIITVKCPGKIYDIATESEKEGIFDAHFRIPKEKFDQLKSLVSSTKQEMDSKAVGEIVKTAVNSILNQSPKIEVPCDMDETGDPKKFQEEISKLRQMAKDGTWKEKMQHPDYEVTDFFENPDKTASFIMVMEPKKRKNK